MALFLVLFKAFLVARTDDPARTASLTFRMIRLNSGARGHLASDKKYTLSLLTDGRRSSYPTL